MEVTFTKLDDRSWGIRVEAENGDMPEPGDTVEVAKRDGTTKEVVVGELVSGEDGEAVFLIAPKLKRDGTRRGKRELSIVEVLVAKMAAAADLVRVAADEETREADAAEALEQALELLSGK